MKEYAKTFSEFFARVKTILNIEFLNIFIYNQTCFLSRSSILGLSRFKHLYVYFTYKHAREGGGQGGLRPQ